MNYRVVALVFVAAGALFAGDVSGDWEFASTYLGDTSYSRVSLKQTGEILTGSLNELRLEGLVVVVPQWSA